MYIVSTFSEAILVQASPTLIIQNTIVFVAHIASHKYSLAGTFFYKRLHAKGSRVPDAFSAVLTIAIHEQMSFCLTF